MTLRTKTLFIIGATLASLVGVIYVSAHLILMRGYSDLEAQDTQENVERVLNAFYVQLDNLVTIALGYSIWDDTYQFISDADMLYVERNMIDLTFAYNSLNLIMLLNNDLEIVFQKAFDLQNEEEIPVPQSIYPHLLPGSLLVTHSDPKSIVNGVLTLPEGYLIISSQPVVTSDGTGPINGIQIWGRFLDESQIAQLAVSTGFDITVQPAGDPLLSEEQKTIAAQGDDSRIVVQTLDSDVITGSSVIDDIYGNPAMRLRIELPRRIYAQGQASVSYFWAALALSSGVIVLVTVTLLEKNVLARIATLSASITRVRASGDLNTPVPIHGSDEIANLADGMRGMLAALAQSRVTLQEAHDQLEKRVEQRTVELSESNALLRQEIAERKQAQEHLAQARDQALEALRLKSRILANVSHDARTPLTTIMLRTELLQLGRYGQLTDQQNTTLDSILVNARQLLEFVNNLLTEAQLSGDKLQLARVEFPLAAMLEEVRTSILPLAERKDLLLSMTLADDVPVQAHGDPNRIREILTNLLDNAIKFTDQGTVSLSIYRIDPARLALEVSDTGKGIPEEAQQHIFEPFWQLDGSITRTANRGVGLGLSIVKQLIALMQGEITVVSQVGCGSTFTVVLPLSEAKGEKKDAEASNNGR